MNTGNFGTFLEEAPCILGEGAVIERLRRNSGFELDPHIVNSAFIYDDARRSALETIYREYLDIGHQYNLPLVLSTPTWRASRERIEAAGYVDRNVNADNFRFLDALRKSYGEYAGNVFVCGLLSCRGDAYNQTVALGTGEAHQFHAWQAGMLANAGVDFLLAATLPAISEALGLALALADTGTPYILSFVLRPEGTLLDGTLLRDAISEIDATVRPMPLAYMANCTHASIFESVLRHVANSSSAVRQRLVGLFANTAALTPEELDDRPDLVEEDPEAFSHSVAAVHKEFGMKILGGCCGTDNRHIRSLAVELASSYSET
ncbi:homocysteine S-methyltransferase domain protein [Olavius algarvensis associated proteobacterium Delta 3]|nr:homocysteine S-methyltransferase domain protein [Olavius algarvensis associated proteobacterium Delta 3]